MKANGRCLRAQYCINSHLSHGKHQVATPRAPPKGPILRRSYLDAAVVFGQEMVNFTSGPRPALGVLSKSIHP